MTRQQPSTRRLAVPYILLSGGVALILFSFMLPARLLSQSNWTPEQAKQYQAASLKLHSLSHASLHSTPEADREAQQNQLKQADADYQAIRSQLDSATKRPKNIAFAMRILGAGLLIVGGITLYFTRTQD